MDFQIDWEREVRTGVAEAVLCEGKTTAQINAIVAAAEAAGRRMLFTRLGREAAADISAAGPFDYDPLSETAFLGALPPGANTGIGVVAAGTSDLRVAREAVRALQFAGHAAPIIADVGVAGLWRLMSRVEELRQFKILIACAGMEGALFSVLAGLVAAPVVAVPTSVGYGVAKGGAVALHAALASCAPGIVTVNIDNGFGAAAAALKMLSIGR